MHPAMAAILSSHVVPVKCRLLGTQRLTSGGSAVWTFNAFNGGGNGLGATTQKKQIVVLAYSSSGSLSNIMTGCTIAGGAAASVSSLGNINLNTNLRIFKASVAATSGDIVIASNAAVTEVAVAIYEVLNADTNVLDNEFVYDPATATFGVNIDQKGDGCIIAGAMTVLGSGAPAFAWSNVTETYEFASGVRGFSFASNDNTLAGGALAVETTVSGGSALAGQAGMIAVSFRPAQ